MTVTPHEDAGRSVEHLLVAEKGPLAGRPFPITREGVWVGRQPAVDQIVLDDPEVGRLHARLYVDPAGKVRLEDNASVNGTRVNNRRVREVTLNPGDRIQFALDPWNLFVYIRRRKEEVPLGADDELQSSKERAVQVAKASWGERTIFLGESSAGGPRLQLIVDRYAVEDVLLEPPKIVLGRHSGPGKVAIEHSSVYDPHAEMVCIGDRFWELRDLGSPHGTRLNGQRIEGWHRLQDGDLVQLGECDMRLLLYREARGRCLQLRDFELSRPLVTLGSDKRNTIHLDHPTVSRSHAEIRKLDGVFELLDKGSKNGTYVNGVRIERHQLQARDRITLGAVQVVFDGNQIEQQASGGGARISARGLSRSVPLKGSHSKRVLFDGISLAIEPYEFVGLLGPSGAGKTTLMQALSAFKPADTGQVFVNGWDLYQDLAALRTLLGYLPQDDILHHNLTVRASLYYSARLRLPEDYSETDIWDRVLEVLDTLDLTERADLLISQLSGGQRKRVSLGIELVKKPSVLFMDEPAAGQDPRTEMKMMQLFREVANRGSTLIITTHLLGSFSLLDKVAVLVQGKLAYFGPSSEMLSYFRASRPHEVYDRLQDRSSEEWQRRYLESDYYEEFVSNLLGEEEVVRSKRPMSQPVRARASRHQFKTLLIRQAALKLSDWSNLCWLFIPPVAISFLVGLLENQANGPKVLFMVVFAALWFGCSVSAREFVDERAIYRRERQVGLTLPCYVGSKLVFIGGVAVLQGFIFIGILTLMGSQANHFWNALGLMWIMMLQGGLLGLLISALSSTPEKAIYAFPLALIPQLLLAGLFIPVKTPDRFFPLETGGKVALYVPPGNLARQPPGMGPLLANVVSPLMVARWGLEALADLYIHDLYRLPSSVEDFRRRAYGYALINEISISLHPDEVRHVRAYTVALIQWLQNPQSLEVPSPPGSQTALTSYLAILVGFTIGMIVLISVTLKVKEGT